MRIRSQEKSVTTTKKVVDGPDPGFYHCAMRLPQFLEKHGYTMSAFARKSGVKITTIAKICGGGGATATTAIKIIRATRGQVKLEDLTPNRPSPKRKSRQAA